MTSARIPYSEEISSETADECRVVRAGAGRRPAIPSAKNRRHGTKGISENERGMDPVQ